MPYSLINSHKNLSTREITVSLVSPNMDCEESLVLDLLPTAKRIEAQFGDLLLDPLPGIYRAEEITPVMIPGNEYFHKVNGVLVHIEDINQVKSAVYDKREKQVIPGFHMRHKDSMLSDRPKLPQRGTMIADLLINQHLDNFVSWRTHGANYIDKLRTHFEPEAFSDEEFDLYMEELGFEVCRDVADWIGNKRWHIFLTKRKNTALHIGQYGDYRVRDWMERHAKGEIKL